MAYPKETQNKLRKFYVFGQLSLELAAAQIPVPFATARRWKADALKNGDDWDKVKAAHTMAGGTLDDIGREILTGFLLQYRTVMEQLNSSDLPAQAKVPLLASLSDAYTKTTIASKKILPETSQLATALEVLRFQGEYIQQNHPKLLGDFVQILDGFGQELEKRYG